MKNIPRGEFILNKAIRASPGPRVFVRGQHNMGGEEPATGMRPSSHVKWITAREVGMLHHEFSPNPGSQLFAGPNNTKMRLLQLMFIINMMICIFLT